MKCNFLISFTSTFKPTNLYLPPHSPLSFIPPHTIYPFSVCIVTLIPSPSLQPLSFLHFYLLLMIRLSNNLYLSRLIQKLITLYEERKKIKGGKFSLHPIVGNISFIFLENSIETLGILYTLFKLRFQNG